MPGGMELLLDTGGGGFSSAPSSSSSAANRSSFDSSGWPVNSGGALPSWAVGAGIALAALALLILARRR